MTDKPKPAPAPVSPPAKKTNPKSPWRIFTKHYFSKRGKR